MNLFPKIPLLYATSRTFYLDKMMDNIYKSTFITTKYIAGIPGEFQEEMFVYFVDKNNALCYIFSGYDSGRRPHDENYIRGTESEQTADSSDE